MSATVLVVEDYADLRAALVSTLAREHYVCDSAQSRDAVAMLRDHDYNTVLLAPRLPIADDPVVQYLAAHGHPSRVILMMDSDSSQDEFRKLEKPFNREQLVAQLTPR